MSSQTQLSGAVPVDWGSPRFTTREVRGLQVTDAWFPPNAELKSHVHDRAVVAVTLSGAIESKLIGRTVLGRAGDVWTEPLGDPHGNRVGPQGARVLVIQPDPRRTDLLEPCSALLDGVNHFRHGGIQHVAQRLQVEMRRRGALSALMVEGLALEILASGTDRAGGVHDVAWFGKLLDVLHDRFRECPTISELAHEANVHPAHLTRVFRSRMGTSLGRYLRGLRVQWAAIRLAESTDPIGSIALQAGFADQSHFTREFKKQFGTTPLAFRTSRGQEDRIQ